MGQIPDMEFSRICVSSTGGSGGKTLLSLGLGRALARRGMVVAPFKKGPDYIDAAWLALACGQPSSNLDLFFLEAAELRQRFSSTLFRAAERNPGRRVMALLEGNRGLYDGLDERGSCSTAAVARALDAHILLCVNVTRATRTVAAILKGLVSFEPGLNFCGVVLNRAGSSRHESAVRRAIEANTDLPVLGCIPRLPENPFPERHMGLTPSSGMIVEAQADLDRIANLVEATCDVDSILARAEPAPVCPEPAFRTVEMVSSPPRIGYVLDKALWFYYGENLEALRAAGGRLEPLSLFGDGDPAAWEGLDGLYLGGGFPEDHAAEISASPHLSKIAAMARCGKPIYAECGGLLILGKGLSRSGQFYPMAGVFNLAAEFTPRPVGLGYVRGTIIADNPFYPIGMDFRGHEFHYTLCQTGESGFALALERGVGIKEADDGALDGLVMHNVWASYAHIFAPSLPCWATNFVGAARG